MRLTFPPCTEYSIDNGRNVVAGPELINAGTDAFCFTTDVRTNTYAGIAQFTSNDRIVVSGVASVDDLSFTTGAGGGADDLYITYNSTTTGTVDIIVLSDVITGAGPVFDYASAVSALGFDFLSIAPAEPCTEYSIDVGSVFGSDPAVLIDAGTDAFCFTTQVAVNTDVEITNFTDNDEIIVSGVDNVSELSFTSGVGPDATDLIIVRNNTATGTYDQIVLHDVLVNPGFVFDYATAVAAVGFHFITIDPCTPVSIDVGTLAGPPVVFDASGDEYCFTDNANVITDVVINGFSSNDVIKVSNATASTYGFTTGIGADSSVLIITFNNLPTSFNQIVLDNVITNPGFVDDYASAVVDVGFDFMTFA